MDFTTRSREALGAAQQVAVSTGNPQLEPVHLLDALLGESDGIPVALLQALGVERAEVAAKADAAVARLPRVAGETASGGADRGAPCRDDEGVDHPLTVPARRGLPCRHR